MTNLFMSIDRNVIIRTSNQHVNLLLLVNPQHVNVVRYVALIVGSKFIDNVGLLDWIGNWLIHSISAIHKELSNWDLNLELRCKSYIIKSKWSFSYSFIDHISSPNGVFNNETRTVCVFKHVL